MTVAELTRRVDALLEQVQKARAVGGAEGVRRLNAIETALAQLSIDLRTLPLETAAPSPSPTIGTAS